MFTKAVTFLFIYFASTNANDTRLGLPVPEDEKFYSEIVESPSEFWYSPNDVVVEAPDDKEISAMIVTDLTDDKVGEAYVKSGGIGKDSITVSLAGPSMLQGYKFKVEVYAAESSASSDEMSKNSDCKLRINGRVFTC